MAGSKGERRLLAASVALWHLFVLCSMAYLLGLLRPRSPFLQKQWLAPLTTWARLGNFFEFATGRAALAFYLLALAAGILVLVAYLLRREAGWILMCAWNAVGAANFFPLSWKMRRLSAGLALTAVFAVMALLSYWSRPRLPRSG